MKPSVGFIGLGLMGSPMAARLLTSGFRLTLYNRTVQKAEALVKRGASLSPSPHAVAERSDIVISMVSNSEALEKIATGPDGVMSGLRHGGVHIDMSTVAPSLTRQLSVAYEKEGCHFLHSPVLGSVPQATDGSLLLFAGGTNDAFDLAKPVIEILGSRVWRFERPEQATQAKLLCNSFIAGMMSTLGQALVYAEKADVDAEILLDILANSSLNAPMYQTKGKSALARNFAPRFFAEHMLKDINLLLDAGNEMSLSLPVAETARRLFADTVASGYGREDYSAVVKVLERH